MNKATTATAMWWARYKMWYALPVKYSPREAPKELSGLEVNLNALFWIKAAIGYLLVAIGALVLSVVISFATTAFLMNNDSPFVGLLWMLVLLMEGIPIIAACLGVTAELIGRRVNNRHFQWRKAISRSLIALAIFAGPLYSALWVSPLTENRRPVHWVLNEVVFYCLSGISAYLALRIGKEPTPHRQ